MNVPFLDLKAGFHELGSELDEAISRVLRSGAYVGGDEVDAFEKEWAAYVGAAECVGLNSGFDALYLGLRALDVGAGDEVIVPSNTFVATWLAVTQCGAKPVPVEPDARTYTISAPAIERALTDRTRVIVPVHLYGQTVDLQPIQELAKRRGLRILEDAAQAHGASYKGRRIGALSDATAWSFYPGKNLGALGDGGGVTTNDAGLARKIRVLGNYGSTVKYVHEAQGVNSRLDPIQAAVLRVKLRHLDVWNSRRRSIAAAYDAAFAGLDLERPYVASYGEPVWHLYVVRCDRRDELQSLLAQDGIQTLVHYPVPPHLQPAYAEEDYGPGSFSVAEHLARTVLSLPIGPQMNDAQLEAVVGAVCTRAELLVS